MACSRPRARARRPGATTDCTTIGSKLAISRGFPFSSIAKSAAVRPVTGRPASSTTTASIRTISAAAGKRGGSWAAAPARRPNAPNAATPTTRTNVPKPARTRSAMATSRRPSSLRLVANRGRTSSFRGDTPDGPIAFCGGSCKTRDGLSDGTGSASLSGVGTRSRDKEDLVRAPVKTILSVLLTAGGLLPAQEPPPTFTSDTQVVLLDLVARDRKGKTVADLRADEVQVFEDGTRCEIAVVPARAGPGKGRARATAGRTVSGDGRLGTRGRDPVPGQPRGPRLRRPARRHRPARPAGRPRPAREGVPDEHLVRGLQGGPGRHASRCRPSRATRPGSPRPWTSRRRATTRGGRTRGFAADGHDSPRDDHHPGGRAHPTGRPAQPGARRDRRPGRSGTSRRSPTGRRPSTRSTACSPSPGASSLSADGSRSSTSPRPARCPTAWPASTTRRSARPTGRT